MRVVTQFPLDASRSRRHSPGEPAINRRYLSPLAVALVFLAISHSVGAQGGPPLLTDDPDTPGNRHWEINTAYTLERVRDEKSKNLPRIDVNYGLGDQIQLKYEVAWMSLDQGDAAGTRSGLSNSLMGVKWRFLDEEKTGFNMSIYPQLEFNNPTASVDRGLADKGPNRLLPIEASKSFGIWRLVGEVGYWFMHDLPDQWIYGVAVGYPYSETLELLCELHTTADHSFHHDDTVLNLGLRKELSERFTLLTSAGTGLRNSDERTEFVGYFGLQMHFR